MKLENKVVMLTGAASGIGRALAIELSALNCELALIDRDEFGLNETLSLLSDNAQKTTSHICDLSVASEVKSLSQHVLSEHERIDILINNAGVAIGGSFEQVSEVDFDWLMRINFDAPVSLIRSLLPTMRQNGKQAKIVNISSLYGLISPPGQTAYCASKFALRGVSNALRHELKDGNVSLLVVHPGGIATSIAKNAKAPANVTRTEIERQRKLMNSLLRMPPTKAATQIINAIKNDRARLLIGFDAKFVSIIERLMPVNYWPIIEKLMKR